MNRETLPETAIISKDCTNQGYLFCGLAKNAFERMITIIRSFKVTEKAYTDNVIGIIGSRGCGKTSLLESVVATLKERRYFVPGETEEFRVYPLGNPLDPKVLPNCIGIVDFVLSGLFHEFSSLAKRLTENEANNVYQIFDSLMLAASNLKQKERGNVLDNPSDLDDLFGMTDIRSQMSLLVKKLLTIKNGNDLEGQSAFLVTIDDFDLDTRNAYNMTLDMMSYLNIDGLILMVAMDETVFEEEIQRGRIKEVSDYGEITRSLFARRVEGTRPLPPDRRMTSLENKAKKYELQVYAKFIPLSARFIFDSFNLRSQNEIVYGKVAAFADLLFGFENAPYKDALAPKTLFLNELTIWNDLRMRNQVINRLMEIFQSVSQEALDARFFNKIGEFLNRYVPASQGQNIRIVADLLCSVGAREGLLNHFAAIERDTFFTLKQGVGQISVIGKDYFTRHPAAVLIYNQSVDIFLETAGKEYSQFFSTIETISGGSITRSPNDGASMRYGDAEIGVETMLEALERGDLSLMYKYATHFINNPSAIKRPVASEIAQKLKDYLIVQPNYSMEVTEKIRAAVSSIEESYQKPWKQAGETQKRREEIREALLKCRRYLR